MNGLSVFDKYDELFVHYGHDQFDSALFQPVENISFMKPKGGFWSAPVNTDNGWDEFLREEFWDDPQTLERLNHQFQFQVKKDARVLNIASLEDLNDKQLPTRTLTGNYQVLDFEKLAQDYDAMFLDLSHDTRLDYLHDSRVRGFDVDTLLVFNPDIIRQSADIDVTAPLSPTPSLNEIYQKKIDERFYSYKDTFVRLAKERQLHEEAERIDSLSLEEFAAEARKDMDEVLSTLIPESQRRLLEQMGESTVYSGLYYGEIVAKRADAFVDMVQTMAVRQDALLLRKNDSLILFAHGTPTGNIALNGKEYSPKTVVQGMHKAGLVPEDIREIFTMNCYGGKQTSFIGPGGIKVGSSHTSTSPVLATAMVDLSNPMFGVSLSTGDMTDEFKRFSLEDGQLEVLYSAQEINDALGIKPRKSSWQNAEVEIIDVSIVPEAEANAQATDKVISDEDMAKASRNTDSLKSTGEQDVMKLLEQYGAYSDEFYEKRGLNPTEQRQAIKELYESKGAELPEGLKKYFPDAPEVPAQAQPQGFVVDDQKGFVIEDAPPSVKHVAEDMPRAATKKVDVDVPEKPAAKVAKAADAAQDATKALSKKQLGSTGKLAIGAVIAGLVIGSLMDDDDKGPAGPAPRGNAPRMTSSTYYGIQANSNDAQIAANISSYGYGRRVGGFM